MWRAFKRKIKDSRSCEKKFRHCKDGRTHRSICMTVKEQKQWLPCLAQVLAALRYYLLPFPSSPALFSSSHLPSALIACLSELLCCLLEFSNVIHHLSPGSMGLGLINLLTRNDYTRSECLSFRVPASSCDNNISMSLSQYHWAIWVHRVLTGITI